MLNSELFRVRNNSLVYCWILVLLAVLLGAGCSRVDDGMVRGRKAINTVMDRTERVMDENPALADSLIKQIDPQFIRGKEKRARYALLYTAVEYKNFKSAKSDSLIMTAVRFYSIRNNLEYKFLSYYNLGCVYLDLQLISDAGAAFANAEQLSTLIENDYWKGLLFSCLGSVFTQACDYRRAADYYDQSASSFARVGKERHKLYELLHLGQARMNMEDYIVADSILRIVENESVTIKDSVLHNACLYNRMSCLLYLNETDSVTALMNKNRLESEEMTQIFGYNEMMFSYYISVKDYAKSELFLERARNCVSSEDDTIYFYYISSLFAQKKGRFEDALKYYNDYTSVQNKSLRKILNQPILKVQNEQYKIMAENEMLKYRHARLTLILCVVIFLLILVIVLVTYHYKKKRIKEQLYDSLAVVDELSGKIENLKNQVRVQFHERHDISNRLYSMYFDSTSQDKITKQQLNVTINSLIKDYTAPESVRKLDKLLNESYDGIMECLIDPEIGLTEKELELFRYSFAGLSSKSVSVIIKETPQNIYQIKSRSLKKVRRYSEELWNRLNIIC